MTDATTVWQVDLATTYGDRAERHASAGKKLRPHAECSVARPEETAELTLAFDVSIQALVEDVAEAALLAATGEHVYVREVKWTLTRDGEAAAGGTDPLVCRPRDAGIALDVVAFEDRGSVTVGRFDPDVPNESLLPDGPVPIATDDLLEALRDAGAVALERYRTHDAGDSRPRARLRGVVRDVEDVLDCVEDGRFTGFDDALASVERVWDPAADDLGPIESTWLRNRARDDDRIARLVTERVATLDPERAADVYHGLLTDEDGAFPRRTLAALERHPDEKAVPALLIRLWSDGPDTAPAAIDVLGTLLDECEEFTENDRGYDREKVIDELVGRVESSEHPEIRVAAIEALDDAGETDRDGVRGAIESALDDSDEDVRAAAERALEADDT